MKSYEEKIREAFEETIKAEGRHRMLEQHPIHPGIYAHNETTRRFKSFVAGIEFANNLK